jgi:peptide/nickel transport system substrate-binding protein
MHLNALGGLRRWLSFALVGAAVAALPAVAQAETVVRVAMTAADLPDWTGATDQGYEGYRFVGYSLYDALIDWDLTRSDVPADIKPGLAESWAIDPNDDKNGSSSSAKE